MNFFHLIAKPEHVVGNQFTTQLLSRKLIMSDHGISIVPGQSADPGDKIKAKEILEWLISLVIVKLTLSDCIRHIANP